MAEGFRRSASIVLGVPTDWILVGNGSDDLLTMIIRACVEPGRRVVYPTPTAVSDFNSDQSAEFVEVSYDENYNLPLDELVEANGAVIFVASPNSPSGTALLVEQLDKLATRADRQSFR